MVYTVGDPGIVALVIAAVVLELIVVVVIVVVVVVVVGVEVVAVTIVEALLLFRCSLTVHTFISKLPNGTHDGASISFLVVSGVKTTGAGSSV
jgi:hypothetical protein